ncbi:hypothetical protein DDE18_05330 [Nocardioides gansuensis]|uniref:RNA polymerase sigma-70 ECF-like HTH domain-containing protein n=1 Tax=Nocardioides gansuensis TaxID=2138300 RepID=A0A2T8FDG4_9ACTN|nr:sigma-70 family RNA polymerase sigma factor [Nocardioides gansuensis]PVG83740.1 hypothetical protein DDE18_05330 [Nocardioides gansuensis]
MGGDEAQTDGATSEFLTSLPDVQRLAGSVEPMVRRIVRRRASAYPGMFNSADIEELTGTVLEMYARAWDRGKGEVDRGDQTDEHGQPLSPDARDDKLGAWLKTVAGRVVIDELRRRGAQRRRGDGPDLALDDDESVDRRLQVALGEMATPSLLTHHKLLLLKALDLVEKKHPKDPELIRLRYELGLSVKEIADRRHESEEAVKKRLQRATKRLRDVIEQIENDALPDET